MSLANVELSTEPTEYVIDLREVTYDTVTGAFSWSSDVEREFLRRRHSFFSSPAHG